jgi:hypothetical protein
MFKKMIKIAYGFKSHKKASKWGHIFLLALIIMRFIKGKNRGGKDIAMIASLSFDQTRMSYSVNMMIVGLFNAMELLRSLIIETVPPPFVIKKEEYHDELTALFQD